MYLRSKFPKPLDEKVKAGVFVGLQIRKLMQDEKFDQCLDEKEKKA